MRRGVTFVILTVLLFAALVVAATGDGKWLTQVPQKDRARLNPAASDPEAPAVGGKLFRMHCTSCHGEDGRGRNGKPSLHSERVRNATPGELEWLLHNGCLKNGMPSWSRLPEEQRWQIVAYLKTFGE